MMFFPSFGQPIIDQVRVKLISGEERIYSPEMMNIGPITQAIYDAENEVYDIRAEDFVAFIPGYAVLVFEVAYNGSHKKEDV